jgi:hypothetical protein
MPFESLSRSERRARASYLRKAAAARPARMTEIPRARWPVHYLNDPSAPTKVYESSRYLAQLYDAGGLEGRAAMRLSICRVTLKDDGRWEEDLQWSELMQVKRECDFGDWYAMEVYPADADIVDVANMRHLWILATPLSIGWFRSAHSISPGHPE